MAIKKGALGRFREEDAKRRPFKTHYYNEAIHQAAMAQPQFMLEALKR